LSKASPAASSRVRATTLYLPGSGTMKRLVCPPETMSAIAGYSTGGFSKTTE
jgi:hypothetical protein